MTAPRFRSTAAFALRAKTPASAVERATFVTFSVGGRRFAAAVEAVERVLRCGDGAAPGGDARPGAMVRYAGRDVPVVDVAAALGLVSRRSPASRTLVLNVAAGWLAAVVDAVHEIVTVDATSIALVGASASGTASASPADHGESPPVSCAGARGTFVKDGREIVVLDVARALGYRFT